MKRLSAIALCLLLLWAQVFALAWPAAAAPAACRCCACQQTDCCVAESSPASQPLTATPVQAVQQSLNLFSPPVSPAWRLPRGEAEALAFFSATTLETSRVPLFTRHCALLI
jgi:hypothetical protein